MSMEVQIALQRGGIQVLTVHSRLSRGHDVKELWEVYLCHCQSDMQLPKHVFMQMGTDVSDLETAHVRLVAVCYRCPRTEILAR
jgi:hypothetical protein